MPKFRNPISYKGPKSTTSRSGQARFGTAAEVAAGTLTDVVVTPSALAGAVDDLLPDATQTVKGKVELATAAEMTTGTDTSRVPAVKVIKDYVDGVAIAGAPDASETVKGIAELATTAEAVAGVDTSRIVTAAGVAAILAAPAAIGSGTPAAGSFTTLGATGAVDFDAGGSWESGGAAIDIAADAQTDAVNIGTGAAARTITIGNTTGATAIAITSGTGHVTLTSTGTGDIIVNSADTCLIDCAGVLELNSSAGVIGIGNDAVAQNINVGTGAAARTITIGNGTGATSLVLDCGTGALNIGTNAIAHTITIGNTTGATAMVLNVGTGNYVVDGAAGSTYNIGASATTGTVTIGGTSQTGNFVLGPSDGIMAMTIANGNGAKTISMGNGVSGNNISIGNGINTSAQTVAIANGAAAGDSTVSILSGNATAGTITLNLGNGNRATAINVGNGTGGNTILVGNGVNGAAQTISIGNGAAGADQTVNVLSGNAAAGTQTLNLAQGTGGKTVNLAAGAGVNVVTIGSGTGASSLDLLAGSGNSTLTVGGSVDMDSTGAFSINASAGVINIGNDADAQNINIGTGAAARTITIGNGTGATSLVLDCGTGALNIGTNAFARTVTIGNTTGASALVLQSGTGEITMTGTVKEINAEFLYASGTDLTVTQSPIVQSNANTGAAPTGTTGAVNLMYLQDGCIMEQFILGAGQTIIAPRMTANGLNLALDQTVSEGAEYNFGARNNAKHAYTIGTSAAFFIEATIYVEDLSGCAPLMVGFRKVEANNATFADYTDYVGIGLNSATSATNVVILDEINSSGQTATDTTDAWGGDAAAQTVKVLVSAAGVVTFEVNGSAASAAPAYTFDNTDVVIPYIHFLHGADVAGEVSLQNLKIGFQA